MIMQQRKKEAKKEIKGMGFAHISIGKVLGGIHSQANIHNQ
jgi:hypothetical protein